MQTKCLIPTTVKAKKPPLNLFTELAELKSEVEEIKRMTTENAAEIKKIIGNLNGANRKGQAKK